MTDTSRPIAIVTGASSGIGLELAKLAAAEGYDLVIAADQPEIHAAASALEAEGQKFEPSRLILLRPKASISCMKSRG